MMESQRISHNTIVAQMHCTLHQAQGRSIQLEQVVQQREAEMAALMQTQALGVSQHLNMSNSLLEQLSASSNREAYLLHATYYYPSGSEAGTLPDLSGKVTLNTTRGQLTLLSQDCVHAGSAVSLSTGKTVTVHCLIGFQKKPDVYSKTTGRKETFTFPYDVPYPVWSEALKQSVQTSSQNRSGWHYEAASRLKACIVATEQGGLLVKLGFHLDLYYELKQVFTVARNRL